MSAVATTNGAGNGSTAALAPPHNRDAEQSVLGAILLSDRSLYALVIEEGLRAEDFYRERHGVIYEAMLALYNESEPVDVLTVTDRLRQAGKLEEVGGAASVDELTGLVPAAGHARRYAQIVAENAALHADHPRPVALFSLEMAEAELAQRFVASQAMIKGDELRKGRVAEQRWPKILKASQRLAGAKLWIDDSSDVGLLEVRAKARRLHGQCEDGLGLIIVDYLQLMRTESRYDNRVTAIGELSRGLKILARELEVPVIAISQLSRAVEQRSPKKPQLSDLRESGNLEQDADLVMFLYRDEYYEKENSERPGEADLIIAKHRNGATGDVVLTFRAEYPKFMNYAPERYTQ